MKIAVLSDGSWGTALAILLVRNGHQVTIWGRLPEHVEAMRTTRRNERFLKGCDLPPALDVTADMAGAVRDADLLLQATPTQYARHTLERLAALAATGDLRPDQVLVNVAKGVEVKTLKRLSQIVAETLGERQPYACLSGPSHAEEVCRGAVTAVVVAATDSDVANRVQQAFMNPSFRVYTSDDVIGVELGGAFKNVFAIAAGICDGMKLGDNAKAALITRGVAEMARLGVALGGRAETFSGLSGLGDMIVTCTSGHSRNRYVGEQLGKGMPLDAIVASMAGSVAEGIATTQSAYGIAHASGVDAPIIDEIFAALYEGKDPRQALRDLMTRDARPEFD